MFLKYFNYMYVCVIVWGCCGIYVQCPQRLEEDVRFPSPGVTGNCEPYIVNAETEFRSSVRAVHGLPA